MQSPSVALTIAGSDSGGGAGIQADLKTFAALGVYGTSAITAVTAQNTTGVLAVHPIPPGIVASQIDAVFDDLPPIAAKTGMLADAPIIEVVAESLRKRAPQWLVVDPVMVAESGASLLEDGAVDSLRERLLPLASLLTPNLPEAEALLGRRLAPDDDELIEAAKELCDMGPAAVLIKGGHREGDADDLLWDGIRARKLSAPRVERDSTHGTGCTLGAAIVAHLARGRTLVDAVTAAKEYVTEGIRTGPQLGAGHGPLHHFHEYYGSEGLP